MISLRISLLLLLLSAPLAHAEAVPAAPAPSKAAPAALTEGETQAIKARAKALHDEAQVRRQAADSKRAANKTACYQRFLVNACLEDVEEAYGEESRAARKLDVEGNTIERDLHAREYSEKAAGFAPEAERKTEAERLRQQQEQQLEDFAKRAGERAERAQAGVAREEELKRQVQQSAGAQQEQVQRNAEAQKRAEEARQKTSANQNAREQAKQRKRDALALEKQLKEKKAGQPETGKAAEKPAAQ